MLPVTATDNSQLRADELSEGWRLACSAGAESDLKIDLGQWDSAILSDDSPFSFEARERFGVVVDLGTTTIVAQLLDLQTGHVLAVNTALNEQVRHGADVMSRVEFALSNQGQRTLERIIRRQIGEPIHGLFTSASLTARRPSISTNVSDLSMLEPRGICGSGLVDAAAAGLEMGWLLPNGRLKGHESITLAPPGNQPK